MDVRVALPGATVTAYNPFGNHGADNAARAALALANTAGEAWSTNEYADGALRKPGVGVYLGLREPVAAARLTLTTPTPGFALQVWARNGAPAVTAGSARTLASLGWHFLGADADARAMTTVGLAEPRTSYRYYLVWITRLEPGRSASAWVSAEIAGVCLWRAVSR